MSQQPIRICILGGGFAGLYTALRLSQFPWTDASKPEIVLVDQHDRFVFLPLLYELMTGELDTWEIAPPFSELLAGTGVHFQQDTVTAIDLDTQRVNLQSGRALPYDRLVLALGGETPVTGVPGASEYAFPFRTLADAYRLEERLRVLEAGEQDCIRVAIVGAGYSGVELACKLADRLGERGRLRLIERGEHVLRSSPEFNREAALRALSDRQVWLDLETSVAAIGPHEISLTYKDTTDTLPVDLVLWTVGTRVPAVVQHLPLKTNTNGQVITQPTLQVSDHPEILALGDLAACHDAEGQWVPTTAQVAIQQAGYAAWNLWADLSQRPLLPFRYQSLGEMLTLGIDNATLTGLGLKLDGPPALLLRRLVYLYRLPSREHQLRVGFNWITRPIADWLLSWSR
ncbi:NAD(P)/FAD-dependent oxidoreductase [Trichothermofontia sp.]